MLPIAVMKQMLVKVVKNLDKNYATPLIKAVVKKGRMASISEVGDIIQEMTDKISTSSFSVKVNPYITQSIFPDLQHHFGWAFTKKIYKLDMDLVGLLIESKPDLSLLTLELLKKLPDFTTAIYSPMELAPGFFMYGFSVCYSESDGIIYEDKLDINGRNIAKFILYTVLDGDRTHTFELDLDTQLLTSSGRLVIDSREGLVEMMEKILPILLYVCSENFHTEGEFPKFQGVKGTKRTFSIPDKVTYVKAGVNDGNIIRKFNSDIKAYKATGRTMKPHIRRAHWHSYWSGATGSKTKLLKFLPNVFVNIDRDMK